MAIPKYDKLYGPFLKAIRDGKIHSLQEIKQYIISLLKLSKEELLKTVPCGHPTIIDNRISWASVYLKKAGFVSSPSRGCYILTDLGKENLPNIEHITNSYLEKYASFKTFVKNTSVKSVDAFAQNKTLEKSEGRSPEEILEDAFRNLNTSLASDLMGEIMKLTPIAFEALVVELLKKMGYGSGIDDAGFVTQASNDRGIDGIIKEDQLGFSFIYIQAKQWALDTKITRPDIQKFIGALHEQNAKKGLFITTASFTEGAKESAKSAGIVLINGEQLTKLMIKFNLGVLVKHVYEVKSLCTDYFEERI
ncbi:MAG: restriction endonuclease [bacterium]